MCGITGYIDLSGRSSEEALRSVVERMTETLVHRGPDDVGIWVDAADSVAMGHRRLAILDLSEAGHQPMESACGRYVMVYNGEIYNHIDLRHELERQAGEELAQFKGHSDTEVMLASFSHWGIVESLKRFNGMFAFAVWDRKEKELTLARDRMGEKPLYYGMIGNAFIFGSELKALVRHPAFTTEIDRDVLTLFLRHGYVPGPYCIYRGINKLVPACFLTLKPGALASGRAIWPFPESGGLGAHMPRYYWSPQEVSERTNADPFTGSDADAVHHLEGLLLDAVAQRMEADVPVGAFLSGGIDSSTVVALMQVQRTRPVRTFSIGFFEAGMNEAHHAKAVAEHLGTSHVELYLTPAQARDVIPQLPHLYDEPFADPSQIPTFLVSRLAREHVTVSLSGDGGDELFGGYERYATAESIWNGVGWASSGFRRFVGRIMAAIPVEALNLTCWWLKPLITRRVNTAGPVGQSLHTLARILAARRPQDLYLVPTSHWHDPASLVRGSKEPRTYITDERLWPNVPDFFQWMMYVDAVSYLPDDILVKVDRASMGVSLEARVPLLDHHIVEFAWSLPASMKYRNGKTKWILRQVLYRHVPETLVERPKMGFGVPIGAWLRGPLKEWAASLLDESRLRQDGYFDPRPIRKAWLQHMGGVCDWQFPLWNVLMFQAWLDSRARNAL